MRVCVILFGRHFGRHQSHRPPFPGVRVEAYDIDYRHTLSAAMHFISNRLFPSHSVEYVLSTEQSPVLSTLTSYTNARETLIVDGGRNEKIARALSVVSRYDNVDIVVCTRFDLVFHRIPLRIRLDCLNVTSQLETSSFIDDNIYIMPHRMASTVGDVFDAYKDHPNGHHLLPHFTARGIQTHFMFNEIGRYVSQLSFFTIYRHPPKQQSNGGHRVRDDGNCMCPRCRSAHGIRSANQQLQRRRNV